MVDWFQQYICLQLDRRRTLLSPQQFHYHKNVAVEPLESASSESEPNFRRTVCNFPLGPDASIKSHAFYPQGSAEIRWKRGGSERRSHAFLFVMRRRIKSVVASMARKSEHGELKIEVKGRDGVSARVQLGKSFEAQAKLPRFCSMEVRYRDREFVISVSHENLGSLQLRRKRDPVAAAPADKPVPYLYLRPLQLTFAPTIRAKLGVDYEIQLQPNGSHLLSLTTPAKGVRLALSTAPRGEENHPTAQLRLGPPDGIQTTLECSDGLSVTTSLVSQRERKGSIHCTNWSGTTSMKPEPLTTFSASATGSEGKSRSVSVSTNGCIQLSMTEKTRRGRYSVEVSKNSKESVAVEMRGAFLI